MGSETQNEKVKEATSLPECLITKCNSMQNLVQESVGTHRPQRNNEGKSFTFLSTDHEAEGEASDDQSLVNKRCLHSRPKKRCSRRLQHPSGRHQRGVSSLSKVENSSFKSLESPCRNDELPATNPVQGSPSCEENFHLNSSLVGVLKETNSRADQSVNVVLVLERGVDERKNRVLAFTPGLRSANFRGPRDPSWKRALWSLSGLLHPFFHLTSRNRINFRTGLHFNQWIALDVHCGTSTGVCRCLLLRR